MRLISPAKINIGLQVAHRRPEDSRHYIASVFVPISFGDELYIEKSSDDSFISDNRLLAGAHSDFEAVSERGDSQGNLIVRVLLASAPYRSVALRVHLTKRIPSGGGLGGGSSNAGALLSYLCRNSLLEQDIAWQLALRLGADIPFFMQPMSALVTGIGEKRQLLAVASGLGVLALTGIVINTEEAYKLLKRPLHRESPPKTLRGLDSKVRQALCASRWSELKTLINDFEEVIFSVHPLLGELKKALLAAGAEYALMSGSGSSLYGLVATESCQERLLQEMRASFPDIHFVPFCF